MLCKYIKLIICVLLICGLVAPSYASLTSSDGSMFVTKAEFDSALGDFNARLTTFEAGVNSKIDSQVTSYLDRNGIWSGKVQDFKKGYIDWTRRGEAGKNIAFYGQNLEAEKYFSINIIFGGILAFYSNKTGLVYLECEDYNKNYYDSAADTTLDARSNIGLMVESLGADYVPAYTSRGFLELWELTDDCKDLPLGSIFYRDYNMSKNLCVYNNKNYYLEDEMVKKAASAKWGIPQNNYRDLAAQGILTRYSTLSYSACSRYQMMGFVNKDKPYALCFRGVYGGWSTNDQTAYIMIDPIASGAGENTIAGNENRYRPDILIDNIRIF